MADVVEQRGLQAFFDRSDLKEITEEALRAKVLASKCLVTIIDPVTFRMSSFAAESKPAGGDPCGGAQAPGRILSPQTLAPSLRGGSPQTTHT